jgi:hydrogenase maturation protein HypF
VASEQIKPAVIRIHFLVSGIVQGVGFRPYVYRLAHDNALTGWVRNTPGGVETELQGPPESLAEFTRLLSCEAPPLAVISSIQSHEIPTSGDDGFIILPSAGGTADVQIAPDSALCPECLSELFDPANRRYLHPFITCTNCGPRYSIITGTPYDRPKTTMAAFPLCPECLKEYHDPSDRRFHAQPLACPDCGPVLRLLDSMGQPCVPATHRPGSAQNTHAIISSCIDHLKAGSIVAIKGIGGYHLAVDACNSEAVSRLRQRKIRDEKPFAVMVADIATARNLTVLNDMEERLLASVESPVVIVRKTPNCPVSDPVAPHNAWLGLMLPYAPIHHLLLRLGNFTALVMTSANRSDEPIAFEDTEALRCLSGIADYFLTHDRSIHVRCDDSVIRVFQNRPLFYRRSRGYVPRSFPLPFKSRTILAVGAELKSSVCLVKDRQAFLSQYIGDLHNDSTYDSFRHTIAHLSRLLEISPEIIACDQHPDYLSTVYASESPLQSISVQHHHAHLAACMAENALTGEVLGLIFDGTGYGTDGTIWGGEFLTGGYDTFRRAGSFLPVRLPGGDVAVREPWRMALAYLHQACGAEAFTLDHPVAKKLTGAEQNLFASMLEKGLNSPLTSSCGRLFDAVAAILNIRHLVSYDGQAAIELEALAEFSDDNEALPFEVIRSTEGLLQLDFSPLFPALISSLRDGVSTADLARRFHTTVAQASCKASIMIARNSGLDRIVLSGGVFQNRLLTEMMYTGLTKSGLQVFTHRLTPPNDGCIALGQAAVAGWQTRRID